jgi:hypothetical protein
MLGIDIALLVGGGLVLVLAGAFVGGQLGRRAEARKQRRQGQRNAEQEKQQLEQRCAICGEATDPSHDLWDREQWWHRKCYREVMR